MFARYFKVYDIQRLYIFTIKNLTNNTVTSRFNSSVITANCVIDDCKKNAVKQVLSVYFDCNSEILKSITTSNKYLLNYNVEKIKTVLELCEEYKINKQLLGKNLWLLDMRSDILKRKLLKVSKMHFVDINHGVPFLSLPEKTLARMLYHIKNEALTIPHGNRLYYLCEKIKVEPQELAQQLSKRSFVYTTPFEGLQKTLQLLLDYNISSENITKDLWVLRYKPEVTKKRLQIFHESGRKNLKPWVVKCSNNVLERSIDIAVKTKQVLGENYSSMNYLADRLQCSSDTVNKMTEKIPSILTARVSKIKDTLDFFFSEGFKAIDIIYVPRVLAHSLVTLKKRLQILRIIGVQPSSLNILCKSKKDFQKHIFMLLKHNQKLYNEVLKISQ